MPTGRKKAEPPKTGDWVYGVKVKQDLNDYDLVTVIDGPASNGQYRVVNWDSSKVQSVSGEYLRMTADERARRIKEQEEEQDRKDQAEYAVKCKRLDTLRQALHEVLPARYSADQDCDIEENRKGWYETVRVPLTVLEIFTGIEPGLKARKKKV